MPQVARLNIDLVAHTAKLTAGLKKATTGIAKFRGFAIGAFKAVGAATVALGAAALGAAYALKRFVQPAFKTVDAAAKLSDQLGVSINSLLAFQIQAQLTGTSNEVLNKGMLELTRRIGEANQGYGEGARGLKMLGLSAKDLAQVGPDEAMKRIADAMQRLETPTQKAAAAYAVFGRQGRELVNFLNAGRQGLDQTAADMEALGLTITRIDAAKIEFANDQFTRMGAITEGVRQKIAAGLAPTLAAAVESILTMGREGQNSAKAWAEGFATVNRVIAKLINLGAGVAAIFKQAQQRIVQLTGILLQDENIKRQAQIGIAKSAQDFNKALKGEFGNQFLKEVERQNAEIAKRFTEAGKTAASSFQEGLGGRNWLSDLINRPGAISLAAFKGTKTVLDFLNKPRFGGVTAQAYSPSAALSRGTQAEFAAIAENRYFRKQGETAEKQLSVMEAMKSILGEIKDTGLAILPAGF